MSIKRIVQNIKDFFFKRKNTFHVESIILPENENMRNELTKILWAYFKTDLAKKRRKQKIFNASVFAASCLSLIFVSLIIFSSLNEIEAGTFDFLDAVVQIGKRISISRKGENNSDIPLSAIDTPAIAASYDTLDSLLSQQDAKLMLPGYMPEGINAIRYTFREDSNSNTILIAYENTLTTECVTYRSSYKNTYYNWVHNTVTGEGAHIEEKIINGVNILFIYAGNTITAELFINNHMINIVGTIKESEMLNIIDGLYETR